MTFSGADGGTFPATWSQQEFWHTVTTHRPHGGYQVPWWVPIGPGHDVGSVAAVLAAQVARHQALRTTVQRDGDGVLRQTVHPHGRIPLWTTEAAPGVNPAEEEGPLKEYLWAEPDVAGELPLRAVVVTRRGRPEVLICQCTHLCIDGHSCALLADEAGAALAGPPQITLPGPSGATSPDGVPVAWRPADLAAWEQQPAGRRLSDRALAHWRRRLAEAPAAVFPWGAPRGTSPLWRGCLDSSVVPAAEVTLARRTGLWSSALLLTAAACVLAEVTGTRRATFRVPSSNRIDRALYGYVGALSQHAVVTVRPEGGTFDELAQAVSRDLLLAYARARYSGDGLAELLAGTPAPDVSLLFNDVRAIDDRAERDSPAVDLDAALRERRDAEISWELLHEHNADLRLYVRVASVEGRTALDAAADVSCLSRQDIERFLHALERLLVHAARQDFPLARTAQVAGL